MATIIDVAALAGVGTGTVSRVLNNSPNVRDETRTRVLVAMEQLSYRPSPLAQALSRGRCHTVGVVVPFFTQSAAVERLRGVVSALQGSGYDLVLFDIDSPRQRSDIIASLTHRDRADGLLVVSLPSPADDLARIVDAGVPVVLIDTVGVDVPMVVTDDVEGGRIATRHLVQLGHERIAFIGEPPDNEFCFTSTARRELGYREIVGAAGGAVDERDVRYCPHEPAAAAALAGELLARRDRPTAVFASSDVQATGVLTAAAAAGLRVPGDLSVVGFDDIEISAYVGLTTVRQPLFESGRLGARLLLEALAPDEAEGPCSEAPSVQEARAATVHELSLELVPRRTTAPPGRRRARRRGADG